MPSVKKTNYYGFNHSAVDKQFTGGLTYVNDMCVNDEYLPVSVYKVDNPDTTRGHKEYMLLQVTNNGKGLVRGMDAAEMSNYSIVDAVHCLQCDSIIYSPNRHTQVYCTCENEAFSDGGTSYIRCGAVDTLKIKIVRLNLLTDEIVNE